MLRYQGVIVIVIIIVIVIVIVVIIPHICNGPRARSRSRIQAWRRRVRSYADDICIVRLQGRIDCRMNHLMVTNEGMDF